MSNCRWHSENLQARKGREKEEQGGSKERWNRSWPTYSQFIDVVEIPPCAIQCDALLRRSILEEYY